MKSLIDAINAIRLIACIVARCPLCGEVHTYFGQYNTGDRVECQKGRGSFVLSFLVDRSPK